MEKGRQQKKELGGEGVHLKLRSASLEKQSTRMQVIALILS